MLRLDLDLVLDSFYVLASLWSGLTGPQVCASSRPPVVHEATVNSTDWARGSDRACGMAREEATSRLARHSRYGVTPKAPARAQRPGE